MEGCFKVGSSLKKMGLFRTNVEGAFDVERLFLNRDGIEETDRIQRLPIVVWDKGTVEKVSKSA